MDNPDPTKFITITDHISALAAQQADFDAINNPLKAKITELEAYSARVALAESVIVGAIQNPELDDSATVATIAATITEAKKSDIEKRRAELLAELAALPPEP
jgi:lipopolysaccharide biosynthesis protein